MHQKQPPESSAVSVFPLAGFVAPFCAVVAAAAPLPLHAAANTPTRRQEDRKTRMVLVPRAPKVVYDSRPVMDAPVRCSRHERGYEALDSLRRGRLERARRDPGAPRS